MGTFCRFGWPDAIRPVTGAELPEARVDPAVADAAHEAVEDAVELVLGAVLDEHARELVVDPFERLLGDRELAGRSVQEAFDVDAARGERLLDPGRRAQRERVAGQLERLLAQCEQLRAPTRPLISRAASVSIGTPRRSVA